jgi:hypothetical protein
MHFTIDPNFCGGFLKCLYFATKSALVEISIRSSDSDVLQYKLNCYVLSKSFIFRLYFQC